MVKPEALPDALTMRLSADDDRSLWEAVLTVAADDASIRAVASERAKLYAIVGACSHWVRPHQSRWTAAGGFALPEGYGDGEGVLGGLPNFDWSITLQFDPARPRWILSTQPPT